MERKTYGGYGLTELRRYAKEYKVPGRSKMDGWSLLGAVRAVWLAQRAEQERALLDSTEVKPGTLLRHKSSGYVIRVLTEVETWQPYGALVVDAEYVELDGWGDERRAERAAYANQGDSYRRERGDIPRHPLFQYEAVTS